MEEITTVAVAQGLNPNDPKTRATIARKIK